jgi:hypothetical protein
MACDVFSLHKICGGDGVKFPFSVKDYQRYVFGDDKLAHQFGTDLARAYIAHWPLAGAANTVSNCNVAVAVLSNCVPTATHNLREHFTAYLNRYLVSLNQRPARKVDIIDLGDACAARDELRADRTETYHIDGTHLGRRNLIILGDIRMGQSQEDAIRKAFELRKIDNTVVFAYLAATDSSTSTTALSSTLSSIVSPSMKDIDNLAHARYFNMTEAFARFVLGGEHKEFCRFLRGQDDYFARKLLNYAIVGVYFEDELYKDNVKFLLWEINARESI